MAKEADPDILFFFLWLETSDINDNGQQNNQNKQAKRAIIFLCLLDKMPFFVRANEDEDPTGTAGASEERQRPRAIPCIYCHCQL